MSKKIIASPININVSVRGLLPAVIVSAVAYISPVMGIYAALPANNSAASFTQEVFLNRAAGYETTANYNGALDALASIATEGISLSEDERQRYLYLLGKGYFATQDPRCLAILEKFAATYPASAEAIEARLMSGDFYFFAGKWSEALEIYRESNLDVLPTSERNLYYYREGVCLLRRGFYAEARPLFKTISTDKAYSLIASYYLGYLDYIEGKNPDAILKFESVAKVQNATASLPKYLYGERLYPEFYLAQCYFRAGEWDKCVKMAQGVLRRDNLPEREMTLETVRVEGMSLYELGDYARAQGLLETYVIGAGDNAGDDALYALGVCEYEAGMYGQAASHFSRILTANDILTQGACLYLGQIEAIDGNPSAAALNFEKAYRMGYDSKVSEAALYNYVAACSQGGNLPFESNVEILERFIENYPDSEYTPAVERHLAWLCYQQGDYEGAVTAINRIKRPTAEDLLLKQKIYYAAGASALSKGNPRKSINLLSEAVKIKSGDGALTAQANIWLGDAYYRTGNYKSAESAYTAALRSGKAGENEALAKYDLAYAKFQSGKYAEAQKYFREITGSLTALTPDIRRDAAVRIADCKYYSGEYNAAKADYLNLKESGSGADYATYRYARILGREGDIKGKINELERFERNFGGSPLLYDVLADLADAYISIDNPGKAASAYSRMIERNPAGPASGKAMLGLAQAYIESGDKDKGILTYRELLVSRPASEEGRLAERELRHYYAETHQLPEYAEFLKGIPGFSLDNKDIEGLMFETAQTEYLDNNSDIAGLREYVDTYPAGQHAAESYEYLAEYYESKGDRANALEAYRGLEQCGSRDMLMTAYSGIMRHTDNAAQRTEYAAKILAGGGAAPEVREQAEYYLAAEHLRAGSASEKRRAVSTLERLSRNPLTEAGAMSAVALGEQYLKDGDSAKAAQLMEEFTSSGSEQQYWVARGFILLADAYKAQGKEYLAKEYLKILRENYPGKEDDIRKMISSRLK